MNAVPITMEYIPVENNGRLIVEAVAWPRDGGGEIYRQRLNPEIVEERLAYAEALAERLGDLHHVAEIIQAIIADVPRLKAEALEPIPAGLLIERFPQLRKPVVEGLFRQTETINFIAASKVGKTHAAIDLALAVVCGRSWLNSFQVELSGTVLYIDCELHRETLAKRIASVASARGIMMDEWAEALHVLSLRGRLKDINQLASFFARIQKNQYRMIVIDSLYRLLPPDTDENSNADVTALYNRVDQYAEQTGAAILIVHHTSKGLQSGKSVVDVGAGAGAAARATDSHIVLRAHEEDDCVVMETTARTFAPINPIVLRWTFPTWTPAPELDPADLRRDSRRKAKEVAGQTWDVDSFVQRFVTLAPQTKETIKQAAKEMGFSYRAVDDFLRAGESAGKLYRWTYGTKKPNQFATIPQQLMELGAKGEQAPQ